MKIRRREFIGLLSAAGIGASGFSERVAFPKTGRIQAIAIDAFVVFDPRPIAESTEELFPGRGKEFANLWRTRQFEYTWLRTIGNRYKDFRQVTEDALNHVASELRISLTETQRERLLAMYGRLPVWPDVPETLAELRRRNIRMAFLSNLSATMLDSNLAAVKLSEFFEPHLTTDRVQSFKPSPAAYEMGPNGFGLDLPEIAFAASASWDAVGAKWFGYPTVWVNRTNAQSEHLDIQADAMTPKFKGVAEWLDQMRS